VTLLVAITLKLLSQLLLAILEELLNQVRLHDLPARITRLLELEPMIDDGLVGLEDELVVLKAGVKATKTAKLPVCLEANASEEGLLFGGGHGVRNVDAAAAGNHLGPLDVELEEAAIARVGDGKGHSGGHGACLWWLLGNGWLVVVFVYVREQ
jgi:hypothetical protein